MPGLREILGIFLPALLCVLLLPVELRARGGTRAALFGVVFAAGWLLGYVLITGSAPTWPSAERTPAAKDWLAWIVALSAAVSLVHAFTPSGGSRALAGVARLVLSAAVAFLPLRSWAVRNDALGALALAALGILVAWVLADLWVARAPGVRAPLALFATCVGASVAALLAHSAVLAMLIGSVASMLAACSVLGLVVPSLRLPAPATALVAIVVLGSVLIGRVTSQLPTASAILIAVALVLPGLATSSAPPEGHRAPESRRWKGAILGALLALAPAALAAWLAWSPDEGGGY